MMRRWRWMLAALVGAGAVLLVVTMMGRRGTPADPVRPGTTRRPNATTNTDGGPVADLRLERLQGAHDAFDEPQRDLFRFRPKPVPPQPTPAPRPQPIAPPVAAVPAGPPPPPPIALRFIGLVDAPTQVGRVAIISDGRGNIFYGREGDTIEGQYKVLRVAQDSIELSYLDGRGRQAIRLTGQ